MRHTADLFSDMCNIPMVNARTARSPYKLINYSDTLLEPLVYKKLKKWLSGLLFLLPLSMDTFAETRFGPKVIYKDDIIEVLGPGPSLQAIINGIDDESSTNQYLIKLGPGYYQINDALIPAPGVKMARFISIQGSGPGITIIAGAISRSTFDETSAMISGASFAALTDLTVENTGGSSHSIAVFNDGASLKMRNITVIASGGTNNYGIVNIGADSANMTHLSATATGGTNAYGIYQMSSDNMMTHIVSTGKDGSSLNRGIHNNFSDPQMTHVTAIASGGATTNSGIYNERSSPVMQHVTSSAKNGTTNNGVENSTFSSPIMNSVTATAEGTGTGNGISNSGASSPIMTLVKASASGSASFSQGMLNTSTSAPKIDSSSFNGQAIGIILNGSADIRITNSQIDGGVGTISSDNTTKTNCRNTYDEDLNDVSC